MVMTETMHPCGWCIKHDGKRMVKDGTTQQWSENRKEHDRLMSVFGVSHAICPECMELERAEIMAFQDRMEKEA